MTVGIPFSFKLITLHLLLETKISEQQLLQKYLRLPIFPKNLYPHCGQFILFITPILELYTKIAESKAFFYIFPYYTQ